MSFNFFHYFITPVGKLFFVANFNFLSVVLNFNFFFLRHCCISDKVKRKPAPPISNNYTPAPVDSFLALRNDVIPMLLTLGPSLHFDPVLMYKVSSHNIEICDFQLFSSIFFFISDNKALQSEPTETRQGK